MQKSTRATVIPPRTATLEQLAAIFPVDDDAIEVKERNSPGEGVFYFLTLKTPQGVRYYHHGSGRWTIDLPSSGDKKLQAAHISKRTFLAFLGK